jgi:Tol biopolymer transport system component
VILRAVLIALFALVVAGPGQGAFGGSNGTLAYFWSGQVWVMAADGSGARSLGAGLSPAWAPNGRRLAFDADANGNNDVWTMRADGRDPRRVTRNPALDYSASWSPDGTQIAFASGGTAINVADAAGHVRTVATGPAGSQLHAPSWSPDGTTIYYVQNFNAKSPVDDWRATCVHR